VLCVCKWGVAPIYSVHVANNQQCSTSSAAAHRPSWRVICSGFTQLTMLLLSLLIELRFHIPLDNKIGHSEMFRKPVSWLGMERLNLTQQKHAFTNEKKFTTTPTKINTQN